MGLKDIAGFGFGYPYELSGSIKPEVDLEIEGSMKAEFDALFADFLRRPEDIELVSDPDAWKAQMWAEHDARIARQQEEREQMWREHDSRVAAQLEEKRRYYDDIDVDREQRDLMISRFVNEKPFENILNILPLENEKHFLETPLRDKFGLGEAPDTDAADFTFDRGGTDLESALAEARRIFAEMDARFPDLKIIPFDEEPPEVDFDKIIPLPGNE